MNDKVKLAYIILAHKDVNQLNCLLEQILYDGDADVFIHVDKNAPDEQIKKVINHPRLKVINTRAAVAWGDISIIDATILLFKEVLAQSKEYDFVCLRSGQDLIVKKGFEDFLAENKGKNFINITRIGLENSISSFILLKWPKIMRKRYGSMHPVRWLRSLVPRFYKKGIHLLPKVNILPKDMDIYFGSQWFCFSYEFVKYVIRYLQDNLWYYKAFENSFVPDEWFFHTLIMSSPFSNTVVNTNLTYLTMGSTVKNKNHPLTITMAVVDLIDKSDKFFARKFESHIDSEVINYYMSKINEARG